MQRGIIMSETQKNKKEETKNNEEIIEKKKRKGALVSEIPDMNVIYEKQPEGDRVSKFLEIFATILKHSNYQPILEQYSKVSAKCGKCAAQCHVYEATRDPKDIPCRRSELLLSVYRRYFSLEGSIYGRLFGGFELTEEHIDEMIYYFWNCTACRKCVLECPMGIDHGLITHLGRYILSEMGLAPRALVISTREQLQGETRNTSAIPLVALEDSLEFLEEEIEDDKEIKVKFPLDVENPDFVFFAPVSDYMMEADTLMGIAVVLHEAGVNWTIPKQFYDSINYGLFYSDLVLGRNLRNIEAEMHRLNGKNVLIGECGHASRSASFLPTFWQHGEVAPMWNIMQLTYKLWKEGKIEFDPDVVTEKVTYHDPCNIARQAWIIEEPRELLKAFCKNYVEMTPNRTENYCCGGGGGTVSIDEIRKYRTTLAGLKKAEQLKAACAHYVVAPCANCKKQIKELIEDNKLDCELVGLHDLIYKAIKLKK